MICTDKVSISSIGKLLDHIQLQIYHFLLITARNHSVFLHFNATMPCQNSHLSLQYN
jgi:hypothetical protein